MLALVSEQPADALQLPLYVYWHIRAADPLYIVIQWRLTVYILSCKKLSLLAVRVTASSRGGGLLHRRGLARQGVSELLALRRARFVPRDGLLCLKPAAGTRVSTVQDNI